MVDFPFEASAQVLSYSHNLLFSSQRNKEESHPEHLYVGGEANCACAKQQRREFRLNCVFREPQHCCSWQEHWGRAMETWCQRSENLNHTPIHLLSKTPQSKKAGWANRDRVTKRQWEQKNRIKFNRVKRHHQREDEQENFFFCLLPFCWCLHHPRVPSAAAVLPAEGKVWCSVVRNINVPIVICLSLLQKQLPLSTGLLSVSSLGYRCWGLAHQPGSQMAVVLLLLPLVLLCSSKAKAMGTWSITQH